MKSKWYRALFYQRLIVGILLLVQLGWLIYFLYSDSTTAKVISIILTIISYCAVLTIISKKEKGAYKLLWSLLLLIIPVFGGLLYLFAEIQSSSRKFDSRLPKVSKKKEDTIALVPDGYVEASSKLDEMMPSVNYLQNYAKYPVYNHTTAKYLSPGEDFYQALLKDLEKAEHYIFMEYFIIQEGKMWNSILDVLKRKASEGVKVRLMYDDFGCFFLLPKDYPKQLKEFGIECVVFNPFRPFLTVVQNNRDHRKIASIDGKIVFTGGTNLADEYINEVERFGHWKDASIRIEGYAAWSMTLMFLQLWELSTNSDEDYAIYYPWKDGEVPESDGFVQPYADTPMDNENVGEHVYMHEITRAKKYLYINTPYLIIDDSMVSALTLAAKSGVDVRIVTPHKWDKFFVHMTTQSYYKDLILGGVKIYEYTPGFIHSKTFVTDDRTATVGTTNLDFRSLYLHFECGIWLCDNEAVLLVKDDFLKTLELCQEIKLEDCQYGFFKRLLQNILRILAPLM